MYTFLNSVAYVTAPHSVLSVLRLPTEEKKQLHDLVDRDIKAGIIRPVMRNVRRYKYTRYHERYTHAKRYCERSKFWDSHLPFFGYRNEEITNNVKQIYTCCEKENSPQKKQHTRQITWDQSRSYIIIGTFRSWLRHHTACAYL